MTAFLSPVERSVPVLRKEGGEPPDGGRSALRITTLCRCIGRSARRPQWRRTSASRAFDRLRNWSSERQHGSRE